jgi:hypothetical protein
MAETWVIVTTDVDQMISFAAKGLHEGWLRSCYRVKDEDKTWLRPDVRQPVSEAELFDQDA